MVRFASSIVALLATSSAVHGAQRRAEEEASGPVEEIKHMIDCMPCADTEGECEIKVKVNMFSGETGYYEFEGCEGVNPNLHLTVGRTYKFDQSDVSNWYHLLGFAYEADGAHVPVDELEPGIAPGDSDCADTATCPAPMYFMDGKYQGKFSNIPDLVDAMGDEDFGLDAVEPLFFHPLGDWQDYGTMVTYLNFDQEFDKDFFYFCHIHSGMSGRVKLINAAGEKLSEEDVPALPYKYNQVGRFDLECGTYNLTNYQLSTEESGPGDMCPGFFVCDNNEAEPKSKYAKCVEAMNCHMMQSMTTYAQGFSELFSHQMIPHHQNAINMAKALLKAHPGALSCATTGALEEGASQPWACDLLPVLYDIVNVQNSQIIDMRDALGQLGAPEYANCEVEFTNLRTPVSQVRQRAAAEESMGEPFVMGADCEPCAGTPVDEQCDIKMGVQHHAGELGYYQIDGCEGVNPTLHLTKGKTYKFDQSAKSNWYHLIGFAYYPDGAHEGVDELEPGIAPGDSTCADDNTCPAPMYFMDGQYQGEFSNIPVLVDAMGSEDFGLDAVEPLFFHPLGEWEGYGAFETYLNFDQDYDKDIFYFCHLHNYMSGRIKLKDAEGNMMSTEDEPAIEYDYDAPEGHDLQCGTFGLNDHQLPNAQCPEKFVCDPIDVGRFGRCVDSMNCAMLDGMTTNYGGDGLAGEAENDVVLFIRQMIPHHQNAVNMAKAILRTGAVACDVTGPTEEGAAQSTACLLEPVALGIVVTQNKQIQIMRSVLAAIGVTEETSDCDFAPPVTIDAGPAPETSADEPAVEEVDKVEDTGKDSGAEGDKVEDAENDSGASDVAVNSVKMIASLIAGAAMI